jgi:ferredoxin-NADP reductase
MQIPDESRREGFLRLKSGISRLSSEGPFRLDISLMKEKEYRTRILFTEFVTHDVKSFIVERPSGYQFHPGQATLVSICQDEWKQEGRPFTFTSLVEDPVLQFIIKQYPDHSGVTKQLHSLSAGDELLIQEPWGTILYRGPGMFLAAGAGVTPFLAILRNLKSKNRLEGNKLLFSNKTHKDILLERELEGIFCENPSDLLLTLSRESRDGYESGRIGRDWLLERVKDLHQNFYICGPPPFVDSMQETLSSIGISSDSMVTEE